MFSGDYHTEYKYKQSYLLQNSIHRMIPIVESNIFSRIINHLMFNIIEIKTLLSSHKEEYRCCNHTIDIIKCCLH